MDEIERIKREKLRKMMFEKGKKPELKIEVNDNNFQEKVIEQSKKTPVVVDFWAQWCAPCFTLGPVLEKLVKEYNGKFILVKVNVNESPKSSREYNIMSIPNVKIFKNGEVVDEFIGAIPEPVVREWLEKNL
jgi:putative thioredoxin